MKIVAVNAGPRKGWNTDLMIGEAVRGAQAAGAEVQVFDLFKLEKYTGCISCFGCKLEQNLGRCICRDGLTPVLDAIGEADGLILGSPNYLGNVTASCRALYERLVFQSLSYKTERPCYNEHPIPVLFIMTSNAGEGYYADLLKGYQQTLNGFVGPTKVLVSGNTLQVNDYERYNWTMFDPEAKKARRESVFPTKLQKAYALGTQMAAGEWTE